MKASELKELRYKVSDNFYLHEFYVSETYPDLAANMEVEIEDVVAISILVHQIVQPVRDFLGYELIIGSGKRDDALNDAVEGSEESQHLLAEAADLEIAGNIAWKVYHWLIEEFSNVIGQCIIYLNQNGIPRFIHVSTKTYRGSRKPCGEFLVKYGGSFYRFAGSRWDS